MITIGAKLKALRESQKLSLRDLADKTGLSASFLSQLELGQVSPSIASLENIAKALNVYITYFFDDTQKTDSVVIRKNERRKIYSKGSMAIIQPLAHEISKKKIEPFMLALEAGGEAGEHPYSSRHGEEFGIVIQGRIGFTLEQNEYVLEEGDSVYFNSFKPHNWKNISRKKAKIILVIPAP
ncbi:MAG: helix-turn-helix domain-containing protein [Deltaproteobacteria bacterium]|nr:helix-turn-helix domain-containing protein [Deltaproteobacteria bacterium]